MAIDKRDLSRVFQERVSLLIERSGGNLSRFAGDAGVDRSAMTSSCPPDRPGCPGPKPWRGSPRPTA